MNFTEFEQKLGPVPTQINVPSKKKSLNETKVLAYLASTKGYPRENIAQALGTTPANVSAYISNVKGSLAIAEEYLKHKGK
jgi:transcriptional regulator